VVHRTWTVGRIEVRGNRRHQAADLAAAEIVVAAVDHKHEQRATKPVIYIDGSGVRLAWNHTNEQINNWGFAGPKTTPV